MNPEQANSLKLEIWREIMRSKPDFYPGGMSHGGLAQMRPAPDPIASAKGAVATFEALYPPTLTVTSMLRRKARKTKQRIK